MKERLKISLHMAPDLKARIAAAADGIGVSFSEFLVAAAEEKALRALTVIDLAKSLFEGNELAAKEWLSRPALALGGKTPRSCLDSDDGANAVRDLIGRLEHGVVI